MSERPLWSEQFLGMLEALRMPAQFQQGRRYARSGRVQSLSISTSLVTGLVLDDDGDTYRARVAVRAFSAADWHRIEQALAGQARHTARLLAGELPPDLVRLFNELGLALFPAQLPDIALECSCQSWQKPCAHLAATCYALAESFDADPFGVLAWRGRARERAPAAPAGRPAPGGARPAAAAGGPRRGGGPGPRGPPPRRGAAPGAPGRAGRGGRRGGGGRGGRRRR